MIESAGAFFRRLREANAQSHLADEVPAERTRRDDLIARLEPAASSSDALFATSSNGPQQQPPQLQQQLSADELNAAEGGPVAAPLRLPPSMPPAWLLLGNLQLYYMRNQPLQRIAQQLLDQAVAGAPAAEAPAVPAEPTVPVVPEAPEAPAVPAPAAHVAPAVPEAPEEPAVPAPAARVAPTMSSTPAVPAVPAPQALPTTPSAPWAAVPPLLEASLDTFASLLERRLLAILTSRVHTLVGCFDTAQQLYDATCMAALPPEVRQAGVYVVINTSEAAMRAQVSLLREKLLAEPVLSTAMPVSRQDFASERVWDCEPRFMPLRDIMRACAAASGAVLYDMLPTGPQRERVDAAVAAALRAAGLPSGFVLPRQLLDAGLVAAARSLLLLTQPRGTVTAAPAAAGASTGGRPAAAPPPSMSFTGAQTPYSVTVMGSHNSYLYGELRRRMLPLDAALSGGDADAPPELVPLGFRPGQVVRDGRLQPCGGYAGWTAESQLAINALGTVSQAQFRAAAARKGGRAAKQAELPPLMNGLNAPVLVLSGGLTSTAIHVEDLALPALNTNVGPAVKVWDVARLDRLGREPVIAAVLGGGVERLSRLRNKQDFRDLLEVGREAGWADGDVITVVQQPGMRVVTTPGYVWHNTVSAGAGVALSTNWMELPAEPAGAWRAHFDAVLDEMSDFARRVERNADKMRWMAGALQLLDGAMGSEVRSQLSAGAQEQLKELQAAMVPVGPQKARKRRR